MTNESWHCPGADADGFVSLEFLEDRASQLIRDQFLEEFPVPALLVVLPEADQLRVRPDLDSSDDAVQLLTVSVRSSMTLRYLNRVAFICKRPGNRFAHLVSVGRSRSNDISIAVDSISKVHGYFAHDGEEWAFTDHSSTNGSQLNNQALPAGERAPLNDGDFLRLGLEVTLQYLNPERMYDRARHR
ncbi:MAG: FHA domain-containing protein [bacterium]|nr:FHA domain-containing protein [bacterium]